MGWKDENERRLRFLKPNPSTVNELVGLFYKTRQRAHAQLNQWVQKGFIHDLGYIRRPGGQRPERAFGGWKPRNLLDEVLITAEIVPAWLCGFSVRRGKYADQDVHADATVWPNEEGDPLIHVEMDLNTEPLTRTDPSQSSIQRQLEDYVGVTDHVVWYGPTEERVASILNLAATIDPDQHRRWFGVIGTGRLINPAGRELINDEFWRSFTTIEQPAP